MDTGLVPLLYKWLVSLESFWSTARVHNAKMKWHSKNFANTFGVGLLLRVLVRGNCGVAATEKNHVTSRDWHALQLPDDTADEADFLPLAVPVAPPLPRPLPLPLPLPLPRPLVAGVLLGVLFSPFSPSLSSLNALLACGGREVLIVSICCGKNYFIKILIIIMLYSLQL